MNYLSYFESGLTASQYMELFESIIDENKTTGPNQSEELTHYTKMNFKRTKRWLGKGQLLSPVISFLNENKKDTKWIVITEAWCGDAAHIVPFLQMMADASDRIDIRFVLRDANLDLMDEFLTNGGRAVPKLICLDDQGQVLFEWGPRPEELQEWYMETKEQNLSFDEVKIELQKWYNNDKGQKIQKEVLDLMKDNFE